MRSCSYFFIVTILLRIISYILSVNVPETELIRPINVDNIIQNDPGYILAESNGDIGERLRVLAAYMYVAEWKYQSRLVFIWEVNQHCSGHFLQIFQPIKDLTFATNSSRYVLDKYAKVNYENSLAVFTWTLSMNRIPRIKYGHLTWKQAEKKMYSKFIPSKDIQMVVDEFVDCFNICNSTSIVIESSSLKKLAKNPKKKFSIDNYYKMIDLSSPNDKFFLLTDSLQLQLDFLKKYGEQKIIIRSIIQPEYETVGTGNTNNEDMKKLISLYDDYRLFSPLQNIIIDVLIAGHSPVVKGSWFSSLSDLVMVTKTVGYEDRGWCKDYGTKR